MTTTPDPTSDVVIAGAGPTGLMLAAELRLYDIRVLVLERHTEPVSYVCIVGLHIRSLEILAMRGLLDRLLPLGRRRPAAGFFAAIPKPAPDGLDTDYPYLLGLPQPVIVDVLERHAVGLGAEVRHGASVAGIEQDDAGVTVVLADGERLRAGFVVGCDGAHSTVRKALGIAFPGEPTRCETLMAEVEVGAAPEEVAAIVRRVAATDPRFSVRPLGPMHQVVVPIGGLSDHTGPPTIDELRHQLRSVAGTDLGVHSPRWLSRFGDATRRAEHYRVDRVLVAGDAAHIHPPIGGQGLNLGVQDAVNLGWKLAAEVQGWAPPGLLDSYELERQPVADDVLALTRAQMALLTPDQGAQAMRQLLGDLLDIDEVNRTLVERITGLDIRYDFGHDDDRIGRRIGDTDVEGGRLFDQMTQARGLLVTGGLGLVVGAWSDRVDIVRRPEPREADDSVLVRPDGHIAWIGNQQDDLDQHLAQWFGASNACQLR